MGIQVMKLNEVVERIFNALSREDKTLLKEKKK
jgi:hypothetical protein